MIASEAELRAVLGLTSSISDDERAMLALVLPGAESAVKRSLKYDPEQRVHDQHYPLHDQRVDVDAIWDKSDDTAYRVTGNQSSETLQLQHIPIRSITTIHQNEDGRFGQNSQFDADDLLTAGTDYWLEAEEDNLCMSGMVYSHGTWATTPGSIKVVYRAGYSPNELRGVADSAQTVDNDGVITNVGVDGSGILRAVLLTGVKAMNTWAQNKKKTLAGFTAGPLSSEKMGDYSYSAANALAMSGMQISVPAEAEQELEPYRNWGLLRL